VLYGHGKRGDFLSLKKFNGSSWVDIKSLKRFNGSSWQEAASMKRFSGSAWLDVFSKVLKLYDAGVWQTISSLINISFGEPSYVTLNPTNIYVDMTAVYLTGSIAKPYSNVKVDLTNYSYLKVTCNGTAYAANDAAMTVFGVYSNKPIANDSESDMAAYAYAFSSSVYDKEEIYTERVTTVNVASLTGFYYLGMRARCGYGTGSHNYVTITKIELL